MWFLIFLAILKTLREETNEYKCKKRKKVGKIGKVKINLEVKSTRQLETFVRIAGHTRTRERLVKGHKRK